MNRIRRVTIIGATIATVVLTMAIPASAAAATGDYADWSIGGSGGAYSGTATVDAAGFPRATVTSDATTIKTPSGETSYLPAGTPPGQVYGSSRGHNYLNISTAKAITTSTTTVAFDSPTPASHWAFALGDIDADQVEISGTDAAGNALTAADLGFAGVFNYCRFPPKPAGCTGPGPFTDVPTWHPGSSRLVGNGPDTAGASGWFQPTVPVASLTFRFTAIIGFPVYQLLLMTLAVPVETTIAGITPGDPVPSPGAVVDLLEADGSTPVVGPNGKPVTATADASGRVGFPAVVDGDYVLRVVPPPGVRTRGATTIAFTVDVSRGSPKLPKGTFTLVVPLRLALTGGPAAPAAALGLALVALGALASWLGRRRLS